MPILLEALPSLSKHPTLGNKSIGIVKLLTDPQFICSIMLIILVYSQVSVIEKNAQSIDYGPFDFVDCIQSFYDYMNLVLSNGSTQ